MSNNNNESNNNDEEKKKTITVRGVDSSLYEKAVVTARQTGKTVGDIVNQALSSFLGLADTAEEKFDKLLTGVKDTGKSFIEGYKESKKNLLIISNVDELTINKDEILRSNNIISFRNIRKLQLNIDEETLKYIDSIIGVDELIIPKGINKILLLSKCKFVKKITEI
ncbi:hypothetical protein DFR86_07610 [Acidianus sulfidivorans JP7]|uniref:Uncharacterized protein n=1 Tax=Acidianus sulfidivorans JP7 TaxID=619593 RepID=A0A2U9IN19_9CREN|nr:hypothetical protein [Acidianus sulfidivorans]AWR97428.1 hypothetical protein DFR86_07610 [Acidianus sulfidivorans JP7]